MPSPSKCGGFGKPPMVPLGMVDGHQGETWAIKNPFQYPMAMAYLVGGAISPS
jgi:hypothetical protein